MQFRSRKRGTMATCLVALAVSSVGCDHSTSVSRKDASVDASDARAQRDSTSDGARSDGDAFADLASQKSDLPGLGDVADVRAEVAGDASHTDAATANGADVADVAADALADVPIGTSDGPGAETGATDALAPDSAQDAARIDALLDASDAAIVKHDAVVIGIDSAGSDGALDGGTPAPFELAVAPNRMLDLVFLIDNSPSMALKQEKLKAQFPKLIDGLRDPSDGTLPDLRVAIIDSDLGTGGAYASGACGPKTLPDGTASSYGDLGRFQMVGATACGVTNPSALWLEYKKGQALNYTGDLSAVFSCLATKLGTLGCGEEHTLQAFEFALVSLGIGNEAQQQMLRPSAYLGLVFLSDEDDCSAATNDAMFGPMSPSLVTEAASLRCATRAHACGGANLSDEPPGYPTSASFFAPFSSCTARTDACPNAIDGDTAIDVSVPTGCSPLRSIGRMANEIKALKSRPEQVFVAGIFGWPLSAADMATATYKIAPVPNPTADPNHPSVFDSWPVCYDPSHLPTNPNATTGFDVTAAYWGATSGLRLASFIDAFADNGLKFSICQPDYSAAMTKIADALSKKMQNLCLPAVYAQRACPARYLRPDANGALVPDATSLPQCNAQQSNVPCYALTTDDALCPGAAYVVSPVQAGGGGADSLPYGTVLEFRCP
jgi:hypothetical protein